MAVEKSEQERLNQLRVQFEADPENMENAISLAEMYSDLGWISESEEIYSLLAKKYPDNYSIQLAYGNICYNKNLREEAFVIFQKLTIMKPERVEGWNNLGIIQMELNDIDDAKDSFLQVLKIEPANYGALLNLGNFYNLTGKNEKALDCFKKVTEYRPDFKDGWFNYGNSLLMQKKYSEAIEVFERSLKYDPLFMSALKNIGYAYDMMSDFDKAIEYYMKALEQNRTDPTIYSNIANVYKQMGKLDEAEDFYQKSVKVAPRESVGWAGLRDISLLEGNLDIYLKSTLAILHRLSSIEVAETCKILRSCGWFKSVSRIIKASNKLKMKGLQLDCERLIELSQNRENDKKCEILYKKIKTSDKLDDEIYRLLMEYAHSKKLWQDVVEFYTSIKMKQFSDKSNYTLSLFDSSKGSVAAKMVEELITQHQLDALSWFLKSLYLLQFKKNENEATPFLIKSLSMGFAEITLLKKYPSMEKLYNKLMETV